MSPEELKTQAGEIPDNTCPDINEVLETVSEVIKDLEYPGKSRIEHTVNDLQSVLDSAAWKLDWNIADKIEKLRKDNEQLRELGKFWYESYCRLYEQFLEVKLATRVID